MCGRYALNVTSEDLSKIFDVEDPPDLPPRFNIAPTQNVVAVRREADNKNYLVLLKWGLIPAWAKDPTFGARCINARADGIAEKPSFRAAFKKRRCLVLASGFYEWAKVDAGKQPYYIYINDRKPFGMAGLWESWRDPAGVEVQSCSIVTTDANDFMKEVHDRMPVILRKESYAPWLDSGAQPAALLELLRPIDASAMARHAVSKIVNNPRVDDARCASPA